MRKKCEKKNLFIITAVLTLSAVLVYFCISYMKANVNKEAEEIKVATVNIAGLSKEKAIEKIQEEVEYWYDNQQFQLYFQHKNVPISKDFVTIDVKQTYENAVKHNSTDLVFSINEDEIKNKIAAISNEKLTVYINYESLLSDISEYINGLKVTEEQINIYEYVTIKKVTNNTVVTATQKINENSKKSMEVFTKYNNKIQLQPFETFSLQKEMAESVGAYSDEIATYVASVLYKICLQSNFEIYERHASNGTNDFLTFGFEAVVKKETRDFSFYNPNKTPYTISLKLEDGSLTASLIGVPFEYSYHASVKDKKKITPEKVVVQYDTVDRTTYRNEEKTGYTLKVIRYTKDDAGAVLKEEVMSNEYYAPEYSVRVNAIETEEPKAAADKRLEEETLEETNENEAFTKWIQSIVEETIKESKETEQSEKSKQTEEDKADVTEDETKIDDE